MKQILITGTSSGVGAAVISSILKYNIPVTIFSTSRRPFPFTKFTNLTRIPLLVNDSNVSGNLSFPFNIKNENLSISTFAHSNGYLLHVQADLSVNSDIIKFASIINQIALCKNRAEQPENLSFHIDALLLNAATVDPLAPIACLDFPAFERYSPILHIFRDICFSLTTIQNRIFILYYLLDCSH